MAKKLLAVFVLGLVFCTLIGHTVSAQRETIYRKQPTAGAARTDHLSAKVPIELFYSDSCHACHKIKQDFLPEILSKYGDQIVFIYHNTGQPDQLALRISLEKEYGIGKGGVPEIFLSNVALLGAKAIRENLAEAIEENLAQTQRPAEQKPIAVADSILWKFSTFSPAVVALAGLIDGINPCAFATMIFFVSFLALNSYRKDQIIYIGASFILAVFLTYLALGLGFFQALKKLQIFALFSQLLYYAIAAFAIGLGVFTLADYIKYKRTGLTQGCNLKLYNRLRALADSRRGTMVLVLAALINGFIIALLELGCTGQVYVPTIAFVLRMPSLRLHALLYLILYNVLFIIPLIIIFLLAYKGVSSENFAHFTNRHFGVMKLCAALLFFALGAFLLLR